ncbi:hypothetical protein IMCC21224_1247 [Puniceibacterium sp. IMCC21224]|nr:hypothetical protein IMCC21224_1247 [Puniceibacterium sp. IMCC21224]
MPHVLSVDPRELRLDQIFHVAQVRLLPPLGVNHDKVQPVQGLAANVLMVDRADYLDKIIEGQFRNRTPPNLRKNVRLEWAEPSPCFAVTFQPHLVKLEELEGHFFESLRPDRLGPERAGITTISYQPPAFNGLLSCPFQADGTCSFSAR